MPRPKTKKQSKALNLNIDVEVLDKLEKYCEIKGQTKTMAIERILTEYIYEFMSNQGIK